MLLQFGTSTLVLLGFVSSHVPCGDASIIPKLDELHGKRKCESTYKLEKRIKTEYASNSDNDLINSTTKEENERITIDTDGDCVGEILDIHRTGAKCVTGEDTKQPGALYHTINAVRTKPGRGDPTLSVSCSDKLARWIACGLQGALLSLLLSGPVLLESVVIGSGGPYNREVLERAIINRTATTHCPRLLQSTLRFPQSRYTVNTSAKPCASAILWARVTNKPLEVCVEGRRQGATKKCRDNGQLMVCKLELLRAFLTVSEVRYKTMTYRSIKESADQYKGVWAQAREHLGSWTTKPKQLEDFVLT